MKIDLEVLASTAIKRKKPWPGIIWIGEEQESLLLLDSHGKRISVLYVPSGKTKKKLTKVSPLVEQVKCFGSTRNGRYLLGILQNGEVFVWHKDKDILKFVEGLDKLTDSYQTESCHVDASDDCSYMFVAIGKSSFWLWVKEKGESILKDKGDPALKGSWHKITVPDGMELPTSESRECSIASVFYENHNLGHCCQFSIVFNKDTVLSVATLVLKFPDPLDAFGKSLPLFSAEWSLLEYPFQQMHPDFEPVSTQGAYVSSYSKSGQVLAVAANQRFPTKTTMLFVSPLTDTVLVGGMRNCGISDIGKIGRQYWVADIAWTSDNLFLACMLKNGSVCLVPRLGDPVPIQTSGCSVNMGPAHFLPLHPAIFVSDNQGSLEPSALEQDPMQQQFSLATHPTLPIVLFSDGFLVTVAQLPVEMTSVSVMRELVLDSARYLKKLYQQENLDMTVADAYKLSKGQKGSKQSLVENRKQRKPYEFELAEVSLNATHESDVSIIDTTNKFGFDQFGAIGNMDAGKIVFGEPEMISIDPNMTFSGLEASDALLKYLEESMSALTLVWKLASSYSEIWTSEVDNITKKTVHNFSKIFEVVLDCPAVDSIIPSLTPRQGSAIQNPRVYNIIVAYRNILQLLRFDTFNQHLITAALRLVHKTITLMLSSKELLQTDPRLKTLYGCYSLLKHAETSLNRVYVWVSSQSQTGTPTSDGSPHRFEPAVMVKMEKQSTGSSTDVRGVHLDNQGQLPGKRLAATWKLLYHHTVEYHSKVRQSGDPKQEGPNIDKLIHAIQQVLQEADAQITPRSASAKLSTVWLRHAFPFELLSSSDSFLCADDNISTIDPKTTSSPSPNMSTLSNHNNSSQTVNSSPNVTSILKNGQNNSFKLKSGPNGTSTMKSDFNDFSALKNGNNSSVEVRSYSSSQKENTSSNQGDVTPSAEGHKMSPKITELSSLSSFESGTGRSSLLLPKPNFKIFTKIKTAMSNINKDPSPRNGTGSTVHVGSMSISSSGNRSSGSLMNGIKSKLNIGSASSSPKESSSNSGSSTMPVVMLDITEQTSCPTNQDKATEDIEQDMPKSEGFDLHDTKDFEVSSKTDSDKLERKKRKKRKKGSSASDRLSVDGEHTLAVEAWKDQLKLFAGSKKDNPKTARMLHSVLYTYLLKDDLGQTVDFVDSLILQASVDTAMNSQELPAYDDGSRPPLMTLVTHRSQDSEEEELVPCIKNKSIRQTVQTMARFMACYFSNQTMYIYPPHSAQALPSVHMSSVPTKTRIIPKYHEDITNVITRDGLSSIWTTERTVEYLLMSGLVCETAWFAHKMGDWKTAYLLSVAHCSHREIAPHLYQKPKKPLQVPESLSPHSILQEKLEVLIKSNRADSAPAGANKKCSRYFIPINQETNIGQLTHTVADMMTAGIVSDVELAPWFLASLTDKLKHVVSSLPVLVPEEFYLPAPPLYCPQAGEEEMGRDDPAVQYEKELRLEISSIIQLLLVALNSAHLTLPTARWYIQELFKMQEKAAQFKATTEGPCLELPEILQQYKILRSDIVEYQDSPNVRQVMSSFRDFCSILWMLHVRDEMSLHLRKRGKQLVNDNLDGKESPESTLGQEYVEECFKILKWAVHMLAFCQYLADEDCIRKVILSLILELPPTEDTADILAEHFYSAENLHPEVQEKLERLLSSWQSVELVPEDDGKSARPEDGEDVRRSADNDDDEDDGSVRKSVTFYQASPRAKTLSVYFYKQCEVVQKVLKKKRKFYGLYDEFVFFPVADNENTMQSGMNSDDVIAIGSRPFETKQSYLEFLDRFYAICFTKVVEKESESGRSSMYPMLMPFAKMIREAEMESFLSKYEETYQKKPSSVVMASPRAKFYRSQSESHVSDGHENKMSQGFARGRSLFKSNSSTDVLQGHNRMSRYESEGSLLTKNSPGRSRGGLPSPSRAKPNMTGMASRFFQSEEVLYKDLGESQEAHWILNVNFGQRYLALQHLLDYLHHWACKQHSLGLHGKDIGLKPTMRIEVPTQLVVLGFWLLENKYSSTKSSKLPKQEPEIEREVIENMEYVPKERARQRVLGTVEELTERDSFTQVSNVPRSRSHSPKGQRSRSHSPKADVSKSASAGFDVSRDRTLEYVKSITSTMEETELKSAYKKVLDGGDDSSSLEVSSLEPDDYDENLKHSLSAAGSGRLGRSKGRIRHKSPRRVESSPETRNNSALNNTLHYDGSPERASRQTPQTSTPMTGNSPVRGRRAEVQADISRISLPPSGGVPGQYTAPPGKPAYYRGGLLGGDQSRTAPPGGEQVIMPQQSGTVGSAPVNLAGMDLAQQLQHIVRGELRRMMEVQHQSMMAMMGALDGQTPVAWQPEIPTNQRQGSSRSPVRGGDQEVTTVEMGKMKGRGSIRGVMGELKNLQVTEQKEQKRRKSKSPGGKENVDSPLRMSELRNGENIEVYRVTQDSGVNFYPNFLRIPAERDSEGVRFPHIPQEAWGPRQNQAPKQDIPYMPLLHVDRTVPGHKFPVNQRSQSLPRYQPDPGYFHPPSGFSPAPAGPTPMQPPRQPESPDSGIGIPLLRLQTSEEKSKRPPRFGELLPPGMMSEMNREKQEQEMLRERYLREYYELQSEKAKEQYKKRFGDRLLHLDLKSATDEEAKISPRKAQTPRKSPTPRKTPSPRKTPRSLSEQISSKSSKRKSARKSPEMVTSPEDAEGREVSDKEPREEDMEEEEESRQGEEESEEEDYTEAESMEEEEELHDGYAIKQGEFEAYLALENALSKTKDTHARIQLKTALRLQRQRMMENWKRPKVDFATNTAEMLDAGIDADFFPPEPDYIRTSEKATSITKDTGVDPIQEAVIEYNQSRQPHVLPPDIYMGLRFNTEDSQESRGRNYLNVVDLDASAVLNDLRERPEQTEPQLDKSLSADQQHIRTRMAQEDESRLAFEPPVIERPTRADELTVKLFETKMQGQDMLSLAIMPRESMPDSKYAIMQRLRDMNSQMAAIDHMSNNIEREFKSTRLALGTLEDMTNAMEPVTSQDLLEEDQRYPEKLVDSRDVSSPVRSSKSPTPSAKMTARSTARSKKSTIAGEERREMSVELAKLSGLSGISDIIGDMVAKGDIDLDDVGLSRREADRLVQRGAIRKDQVHEARVSLDEIKKMAETAHKDGAQDKEALRTWMVNKRHQQMVEYKRHLEELREREPRPFRPKQEDFDFSMTGKEKKAFAEAREESRKHAKKEFMTKRLDEAQDLLGNILTDKPELPKDLPARVTTPRRKVAKDRSPVSVRDRTPRSVRTKGQSQGRKLQGILKTRDVSPPYVADYDYGKENYGDFDLEDDWLLEQQTYQEEPRPLPVQPESDRTRVPPRQISVQPAREPAKGKKPAGLVPKLKLSLEDVHEEEPLKMQQTADTTGDLSDYYKAVEAMDVSSSQEYGQYVARQPVEREVEAEPTPQKTYKVTPYTKLVKVQRPEKTRKQVNKFAQVYNREQARLSISESARTSARTEMTDRERQMIYGTKRSPAKRPTETSPRRVKTYTERLQEMKSGQKYSTPVAPKSHFGSSIASTTARPSSHPVKPKHKPVTYVEQLKKLNQGHHKPRVGAGTMTMQKPMIKSHKPLHKPKTYAQQLQDLQPQKTFKVPPSKRVHKPGVSRQRPYRDPYTSMGQDGPDRMETASVVSAWSMGDDVRDILYNDVESSIAVGQSASYAPSEQVSDYYDAVMGDLGDDYTASVDIDDLVQIADGGSVSSGSMMSFIDWDQVDDLIADIR